MLVSLPLVRAPVLQDQAASLLTSFNLQHQFTGSISNTATLGVRTSIYWFGGDLNIQSITVGEGSLKNWRTHGAIGETVFGLSVG